MTLALVAAAALVAGLLWFSLWRWAQAPRVNWQPVPGHPGARCAVPDGVTPANVGRALELALEALADLGPWDAARLQVVAAPLDVYVMGADVWTDGWGRRVAGAQVGRTLTVGKNLAALAHELAHLAEAVLEGAVDERHLGWEARGIRAAEADYQRRLAG